uniref:Uncharacterized protein n=1 Tax=Amphimedon queenslandica TaxID=400682 RepID=A0A1X7US34_AMPQE
NYEFLCNIYGLSGASGRHCCLWCNVASDQLKIDRSTRNSSTIIQHSLSFLHQQHHDFQLNGANLMMAKLFDNERSISHHEKIVSKGFEKDEGVFVKGLDQALSSFNVERQAYHGGSCIGTHILKALKPDDIHTLTSLVTTAATMGTYIKVKAGEISDKFIDAFILFSKCHEITFYQILILLS